MIGHVVTFAFDNHRATRIGSPVSRLFALGALLCLVPLSCRGDDLTRNRPAAATSDTGWWPTQAMPRAIVRMRNDFSAPRASCEMMAESVAGLAANAVNSGPDDDL